MAGASGKKLDDTYKLAWQRGLKTTYYLRTLAATSAEKSTGKGGELNSVPTHGGGAAHSATAHHPSGPPLDDTTLQLEVPKFCAIDEPECEACQ